MKVRDTVLGDGVEDDWIKARWQKKNAGRMRADGRGVSQWVVAPKAKGRALL